MASTSSSKGDSLTANLETLSTVELYELLRDRSIQEIKKVCMLSKDIAEKCTQDPLATLIKTKRQEEWLEISKLIVSTFSIDHTVDEDVYEDANYFEELEELSPPDHTADFYTFLSEKMSRKEILELIESMRFNLEKDIAKKLDNFALLAVLSTHGYAFDIIPKKYIEMYEFQKLSKVSERKQTEILKHWYPWYKSYLVNQELEKEEKKKRDHEYVYGEGAEYVSDSEDE